MRLIILIVSFSILAVASAANTESGRDYSVSHCLTTDPATSVVQVPWKERHHLEHDSIWYGSKSLAVLLAPNGRWTGMGAKHNYGNKLWFWSEDWVREEESQPNLRVSAREVNNPSLSSESGRATHGFHDYWEAMLTGLEFPSAGCWEVTATYRDATVSFIVRVQDSVATP